jgi:epoxyqueuosine reductase
LLNRSESLTQTIKAEAFRLGFSLAGIALPDPPLHFGVFTRWLEAGRQADMDYLAKGPAVERRADPRRILPEARSVLSVALPYSVSAAAEPQPGLGRVAAYAWGRDYHEIIPARLEALVAAVEAQLGHAIRQRAYTDTGPILEHDLAQSAGLGWVGKNTCLIHPRLGSYFLLGEILLDVTLEPDLPIAHDFCGSCRRCIEACPTQCILPDRTIDAGRCISYLTIENKGAIPVELRPKMGNWVFGCDVCQAVCPWNLRFAGTPADAELAPRPGVPTPNLAVELALTPEEFNHKFKRSPIRRPHRRGYLRNVAVAMGNLADPSLVSHLAGALTGDPEPLVRGHAAWALGRIGTASARAVLDRAIKSEADETVQGEIRAALSG